MSAGTGHTSAIRSNGTLWSWGYNYFGQLGNNDDGYNADRSVPVQEYGKLTTWRVYP